MEFEKKERISIRSKRLTSAVLAVSLMATSTFTGIGPALAHVNDFSDTNPNAWYAHPVTFVSDNKYMVGYGGTDKFGIGENLTRAELAAILANYKGVKLDKDTTNTTGLSDLKDHTWYTAVCNWAVKEKLVVGYEDGTFRPNAPITREEIAAILCRFVDGEMGIDKELQTFPDKYSIGDWAWGSYKWATHYGVILGIKEADGVYLRPKSNVTREQMAAMVERLHEYIKEYGYGYREDEDKPSKPSGPSYETGAPFLEFDLPSYGYVGNKTAFKTTIKNSDGKAIEWTVTKNGVKVTKEDAKISLDNKGGTLLFHKAGKYEVKAVLENHNGKKTTKKDTIIVLSDDKIIIDAPESGYKDEPVKVEIIKPNLGKDATIDVVVEKDGEAVRWEDVIDGELDLDGGDLSFKKKGQYEITITITDSVGRETVETIVIDIVNKAQVILEAPKYSWIDEVNHVTVTTKNTDKKDIVWSIKKDGKDVQDGDYEGKLGNDGGDITFKKAGKYEITATVTDAGNKKYTDKVTVTVLPVDEVGITTNTDKTLINKPVDITIDESDKDRLDSIEVSAKKDGTPIKWSDYITGEITLDGGKLSFKEPGTYEITLTITDKGGKVFNKVITIVVEGEISFDVTAPEYVSVGTKATITTTLTNLNNKTITWSITKDGGPSSVDTSSLTNDGGELTITEAGTYVLTATVNDGYGKDIKVEKTINVLPEITLDLTVNDYGHVGEPTDVTLVTTNLGTNTVDWKITKGGKDVAISDLGTLNNEGGRLTFKEVGEYVVTATVTDQSGKKYTKKTTVNVLENKAFDVKAPSLLQKQEEGTITIGKADKDRIKEISMKVKKDGQDLILNDSNKGIVFGTITKDGGTIQFKQNGDYELTVITTDLSGKAFEKKFNIKVNAAPTTPTVTASFDVDQAHIKNPYTKDAAILLNKTAQSTDPDGDPITYEWDMAGLKVDENGYCKISDLLKDLESSVNWSVSAKAKDNHQGESDWGRYTLNGKPVQDFVKGINQSLTLEVPTTSYTNTATKITLTNENLNDKEITWVIEKDGKPFDYSQAGTLNNTGGSLNLTETGSYKVTAETLNIVGQKVSATKTVEVKAPVVAAGSMTLEAPEYIKQDEATVLTLAPKDMDNDTIKWTITKDGQPFDYSQAGSLTDQGGNLNLTEMGHYEITATGTDSRGKEVTVSKTVNVESKFWQITPDGAIKPSEKTKHNGPYYQEFCAQDGLTIPETFMGITVKKIADYAFYDDSGKGYEVKGKLTIPDTVTHIGVWAFEGCKGLTGSLILPEGLKNIGFTAFDGCSGFTGSLTIPEGVTNIENCTFRDCYGFNGSLIIPEGLQSIGQEAFRNCRGFNGTLTLPKTLQSIGNYAFRNCSGFTGSLTIPEGVTKIGQNTFSDCSGFNGSLTIPSSLTNMGSGSFENCSGLTGSLTIPEGVTNIDWSTFKNCKGLDGNLYLPKSLTSIDQYAFENCSSLKGNISIPNVYKLGKEAFKNCSSLTGELVLPEGITSFAEMVFLNCSGLNSLVLPDDLTSIPDWTFSGCSGFSGPLTLPEGLQSIGNGAFANCSGFTGSLTIPDSVTSIGGSTFSGCSGFNGALTLPDGLQSIDGNAFYECSGLTGPLTLPNSLTKIDYETFSGCRNLTGSLTIPEGVTSIGVRAFNGCRGFNGPLTLPEGLTTIDQGAFNYCVGLTGPLTFPSSLTSIDSWMFEDCWKLPPYNWNNQSYPTYSEFLDAFRVAGNTVN